MTVKELERRVLLLEQQVRKLQNDRSDSPNGPRHNWLATVEEFKNNEDVLAVLADAMKLRERERSAIRKARTKQQRAKS